MGAPIDGFKINYVLPPKLGHSVPASVSADISFTPPTRSAYEWDELREHDILFLVSISAPNRVDGEESSIKDESFPRKYGITSIRGCEVSCLMDEEGGVLSDPNPEKRPKFKSGTRRTLKVWLDPAQYQLDKDRKDKKKKLNASTEEEEDREGMCLKCFISSQPRRWKGYLFHIQPSHSKEV